jgi:DNA-binding transcriptional MerR regulator
VPPKPYLQSGELALLAGVSTDTLRHYERMKLLAVPRRSNGNYRLYAPATLDRVRMIRRALAVGFTLQELAKILKVRDDGGAPCRQVKGLLENKLADLEDRIADLLAMRDHLRLVLKDWNKRLNGTPDGKPALLLATLQEPPGKGHRHENIAHHRGARGRNNRLRPG